MRLDASTCVRRMTSARVAYLATVGIDGGPHIVPITFAVRETRDVAGYQLVTGVDQKPKSTLALRRLQNIAANPKVAVLSDRYEDDWTKLWWVRADGRATVVHDGPVHHEAAAALRAKYPQYHADPPRGPIIVIDVETWSGWSFGGMSPRA